MSTIVVTYMLSFQIEVHAYMCNRNKGCPCLLAVRYSMLFDEIGVCAILLF